MSGTSLDGVDAALLRTDGVVIGETGTALTLSYPDELRGRLRSILGGTGPVDEVERDVTLFHAEAVAKLLEKAGIVASDVAVVGFHGHTILHRPAQGRTWQVGDGALLAAEVGIPVVNDFRTADVADGGQGAPLVPAYHAAMVASLPKPLAVLNLGGVANVTWVGSDDRLLAFDTGPGNALIDDWLLRHTGRRLDHGGALAAAGRIDQSAVAEFAGHPFFARTPPKSLDRDDFRQFAERLSDGLAVGDGAATLTAFTVRAVALAVRHFPEPVERWLVAGGGRHNRAVMNGLREALAVRVDPVEALGWDGDALEAQAFAYLAVRHLRQLPLTWPATTGVTRPRCGGRLHDPVRAQNGRHRPRALP
jgi:anhydro-N-acetylmuramic acid kinase